MQSSDVSSFRLELVTLILTCMKQLLLILTLWPLIVGGQEQFREVQVRTLCFGYSHGMKNLSLAGDPEGVSVVEANLKKYLDSTQQPVTVGNNEILVGALGEEGFETWSKVAIAKPLKEVLLVFFPVDDAEKPYRVRAIDDSEKGFPLKSFLITNMSPHTLRFKIGGKPIEIKSGEIELVTKMDKVKANGQVEYYAYFQDGKEWKRLSSGFWSVLPRKRNFQIAFRNAKTKAVELKGYEDSFPVLKALRRQQEQP